MLVRVEEHVRGFHVAVDEALCVCRIERARNLPADRERAGGFERGLRREQRFEVGSLDEPHRQEETAVDVPGVVDRNDVRMLERHRELRLTGEALVEALVQRELGRDELERNRSLQTQVVRAIDDPHPAPADDLLDPVAEEVGSDLDLGLGVHQFDLVDNDTTAPAGLPGPCS